jgi:hypothetical protein
MRFNSNGYFFLAGFVCFVWASADAATDFTAGLVAGLASSFEAFLATSADVCFLFGIEPPAKGVQTF